MFYDRVDESLRKQGFNKIELGQAGISSYIMQKNEINSCVIFVNLPDELQGDIRGMIYPLQQMKQQIVHEQCSEFLFVYLTNQPETIRVLCNDTIDTHWIIDRRQSRLLIYENQPGDFSGLRSTIEEALIPTIEKPRRLTSYMTLGIISLNVVVFIVLYMLCSSYQREVLIDLGGLYWPAVIKYHEVWRLITSIFIHSGVSHLFNNMLILYFIGSYVEEYVGHARFVVLYFLSGILAGVVSMSYNIFSSRLSLSIGASGAIFGIVGALAAFIILSKGKIRNISASRLIFFIVLSILGGMQTQGVDNMAHIGGLVSGFIIAVIMIAVANIKNRKVEQVRKVDN